MSQIFLVIVPARMFAMFCNANTAFYKLSPESAIMTWSSAKGSVYALFDKVMPYV
jgi:uncharacterized OB-fold protein